MDRTDRTTPQLAIDRLMEAIGPEASTAIITEMVDELLGYTAVIDANATRPGASTRFIKDHLGKMRADEVMRHLYDFAQALHRDEQDALDADVLDEPYEQTG